MELVKIRVQRTLEEILSQAESGRFKTFLVEPEDDRRLSRVIAIANKLLQANIRDVELEIRLKYGRRTKIVDLAVLKSNVIVFVGVPSEGGLLREASKLAEKVSFAREMIIGLEISKDIVGYVVERECSEFLTEDQRDRYKREVHFGSLENLVRMLKP